jgi:hypothetical protein
MFFDLRVPLCAILFYVGNYLILKQFLLDRFRIKIPRSFLL